MTATPPAWNRPPSVVWTIAGFDPSSGAGITADLMVFAAHGLFGCSAITALTVQSTMGVAATEAVSPHILAHTLRHMAADLPPTGVKIGMLGGPAAMKVVAEWLREMPVSAGGHPLPVILDPVLRSSSGRDLYPAEDVPGLRERLLPLVRCITPNWSELRRLAEAPVTNLADAEAAARSLQKSFPKLSIIVTGGDQREPIDLLVPAEGGTIVVAGEHVSTTSTHGTGCAFSSAVLAGLVQGQTLGDAVHSAKAYVTEALRRAPGVGRGRGPMDLLWPMRLGPS